jgi:hypothetical protein
VEGYLGIGSISRELPWRQIGTLRGESLRSETKGRDSLQVCCRRISCKPCTSKEKAPPIDEESDPLMNTDYDCKVATKQCYSRLQQAASSEDPIGCHASCINGTLMRL